MNDRIMIFETGRIIGFDAFSPDVDGDDAKSFIQQWGGFKNGDFIYFPDWGAYMILKDRLEWWKSVLAKAVQLQKRVDSLMAEYGMAIYDVIADVKEQDIEKRIKEIHKKLDQWVKKEARD